MTVGQYCNRHVITTTRSTEIDEVARMMRHHHVGTVVVVEHRGDADYPYPIGIVTDRDLVVEVLAQGLTPSAVTVGDIMSVTVGDIMSSTLVTAKETDNLWHTLDRMSVKGVRRLLVVDAGGVLVGILTVMC